MGINNPIYRFVYALVWSLIWPARIVMFLFTKKSLEITEFIRFSALVVLILSMATTYLILDTNIYQEGIELIQLVAYLLSLIITTRHEFRYFTAVAKTGRAPRGSLTYLCNILLMRFSNAISFGVIVGTLLKLNFP